jgi:hypothetical protein
MRNTTLAIGFGAGRALVGAARLAVPGRVSRTWVGSDDAAADVLARCLGGRDVVRAGD